MGNERSGRWRRGRRAAAGAANAAAGAGKGRGATSTRLDVGEMLAVLEAGVERELAAGCTPRRGRRRGERGCGKGAAAQHEGGSLGASYATQAWVLLVGFACPDKWPWGTPYSSADANLTFWEGCMAGCRTRLTSKTRKSLMENTFWKGSVGQWRRGVNASHRSRRERVEKKKKKGRGLGTRIAQSLRPARAPSLPEPLSGYPPTPLGGWACG